VSQPGTTLEVGTGVGVGEGVGGVAVGDAVASG